MGADGLHGAAHFRSLSDPADDLYALGSMLFLLLTGQVFDPEQPLTIQKLRRNVPRKLCRLVASLLANKPEKRPAADAVRSTLISILRNLNRQRTARVHA